MTNKKYKDRDWLYSQRVIQKKTLAEIGQEFGICQEAVRRWLLKFGIKRPLAIYKDKNWLYGQYIVQERGTGEIGRETGVDGSTIWYWLRKFDIPVRSVGEAVHLCNKHELEIAPRLLSLLEGELLGDGCISWSSNSPYRSAYYCHASKYRQYIEWLSDIFASYGLLQAGKIAKRKHIRMGSECVSYSYSSLSYVPLSAMRQRFYPNGKKIIPRDFVLDPIKAREWYIGDGTIWPRPGKPVITLCTCDFDRNSIEILREQLRLHLIDSTYQPAHNVIYLGVKSAPTFLNYITPCPPEIENLYGYKWAVKSQ